MTKKRRLPQSAFETAIVYELGQLGAFVTSQFRVPGTSFTLDLYIAYPVRAFIEIKSRPSGSSIDAQHLLSQIHQIRELFGDEVVPIIIAGNDILRSVQAAKPELPNAILLSLELGDQRLIESTAKRSAHVIWNHLTRLPYQFKGSISLRTKPSPKQQQLDSLEEEVAKLLGHPRLREPRLGQSESRSAQSKPRLEESIRESRLAPAASERWLSNMTSMDERWDHPFDVFVDVLISLKSVLDPEQFRLLSHELSAFSEEYRHAHYTACGLRVGRTLEHVVYALARAWGVNVNRTTLEVISGLDESVERLKQFAVTTLDQMAMKRSK
jgi:hypothetical protein